MKVKLIVTLVLAIVVSVPSLSMGESTHYFDCTECHMSGVTLDQLGSANVCVRCHSGSGLNTTLNAGSRYNSTGTHETYPNGNFDQGDCSDVYNSGVIPAAQTSHHWAVPTTVNAAAGSKEPSYALYRNMYSRYGTSTGKVTCTRCHDPHGKFDTNPKLLRLSNDNVTPMTENELCEACHSDFVSMGAPSYNGLMTHPIIDSAELNTIILDNPAYDMAGTQNYNAASPYTNSAVLIEGGVSCSSCHGPHFTDSNSSTSDGPGASGGDGFLLRSDRPTSLNTVSYNGVTNRYNTAQLRSNLCQDCHTYKMHGDPAYVAFGGPANPNHNIGCLDCHGGHSYNDNNPSLYVLSDASRDAVPIRFQKNFVSYNSVAYPRITSSDTRGDSGSSRVAWDDDTVGTANGFCEVCHGDVNDPVEPGLAKGVDQHKITGTDECSNCHKHNDDGFAFKLDASAASCGDCHGFPPYLNTRGDRAAWYDSRDGGYAYYNAIGSNYLDSSGHFKDEEKTAHKTHAGRDLESAANTAVLGAEGWYFVGQSGVENCSPCHGPDSGKEAGGHKEDPGPNPNTYRDIDFLTSAIANGFGNILGTAYNADTGDDCTNVYCHSSGAPRTGPTGADGDRNWNAGLTTTPVWVGDGGWPGDGFNSITNSGNGNRCQTCHGNDTVSMNNKQNTWEVHDAHFNSAVIGTNCNICHANTAVDKDTLTANATDHRSASGGQHVNGVQNVSYNTTIYNAALLGETYDPKGDGTCSVYCHDVPDPVNTTGKGRTADWDVAVPMTCNSCHDDQTTTFSIGHQEHTDPVGNGPRIGCDDCHGADSDTGIHAGHIDGVVTYITIPDEGTWGSEYPQNFCNKCHGFDAEVGEVEPLWGEDLSLDPGKYCATCHAGAACGASFNNSSNGKPLDATLLSAARTGGHNRPTASNPYPISGNDAANLGCNACHVTTADSPNHFDGDNYENTDLEADLLLRNGGDDNFVAYLGAEDDFCNNCHGSTPLSSNKASTKTQGIVTHSGKLCVACHTVHGDPVNDNIQMIWSDRLKQNQHDPSGTGMFGASNVFFITNNVAVLGAGSVVLGEGSFDEDDNSDGGISEDNADDLCAVCHIDAGIGHNRRDNVDNQAPAGHNMGTNCTSSCHSAHNDPTEAFVVASGDSCDDCHGYPPSTTSPNGASTSAKVGAHGNGTTIKLHTNVGAIVDVDRLTEDRSDCAWCHTGADEYTYSISDDQAAGGARGNHGLSDANQLAVLADVVNSVGFNSADGSCSNACHKSDAADGFWTDTNFDGNAPAQPGLNCDACHFYSGSVSSGDTPTTGVLATQEHDKHFDKNIQCDICHDVENGGLPVAGGLSHIGSFDFGSGADGNDGDALLDMATTEENESDASAWGVNGTDMVFNDTDNTCSGSGVAANCHATGTPDWDEPIPLTSAGCQDCHTDTTNPTFNPTSGLHNNTAILTVTGVAHDGDLDGGNGCITCHTDSPSTPLSAHIDGSIVTTTITINSTIIATYNSTDLTCNTSCHSAGTTWAYKWTKDVYNSASFKECNGCHGMYSALTDSTGWTDGTMHATGGYEDRGSSHNESGTSSYPCNDCHAVGAAIYGTFAWGTGGHGDGSLQLNNYNAATNTGWTYNSANQTYGCANSCHADAPAYSLPETAVASFDPPDLVIGDKVSASCSGCHGIGAPTGDITGYWPSGDGTRDDGSMNSRGSHQVHIEALAKAVYNETATGAAVDDILRNNTSQHLLLTSDEKQQKLCTFCHGIPGDPISGGHGTVGELPAEVSSMYPLWDTGQVSPDNGFYDNSAADSCATVDCHYNKTTPSTNQWYDTPPNRDCAMCHAVDVTVEAIHTDHTNSFTNGFGITNISCGACHDSETDWVLNKMPANYHIDNLWQIGTAGGGSVAFTYNTPVLESCGTNVCHNDGTHPVTGTPYNEGNANYTWSDDFTDDCTTCHNNPNVEAQTGNSGLRHDQHMNSAIIYTCNNCHASAADATHIDNATDYGGTSNLDYTSAPGCTNDCHISVPARGDWTDSAALACTDCHNSSGGTYVGDAGNFQVSGLHNSVTAPTITGESHDHDFYGSAANCESCHTASPSSSHIDGNPIQSGAVITVNPQGGSYTPAILGNSTGTCTTTCHTADVNWAYQWTTDAYLPVGGANIDECNGCHGAPTTNSWNPGTVHADVPTRGQGAHASTADLTFPCSDCHSIGDNTAAVYDWSAPQWFQNNASSSHGDGNLQINYNTTQFTDVAGDAFCAGTGGCHQENNAKYSFPSVSGTTAWTVAPVTGTRPDVACSGCHGGTDSGGTYLGYWPDNPVEAGDSDTDGAHTVHITELAKAIHGETLLELLSDDTIINPLESSNDKQLELCSLCHALGDGDHGDDANLPAETLAGGNTANDAGLGFYSLWDQGTRDSANYYNTTTLQCSATDCHNGRATDAGGDFNWYTSNSSTCTMCHDDDDVMNPTNPGGKTHQDHLNSATLGAFGINTIDCGSCHDSATNWTGNQAPPIKTPSAGGLHMDNIMQAVGDVSFTYTGSGCGTNVCHNDGTDPVTGTPNEPTYPWGQEVVSDECALCHELEPTTTDHTPHINSPYVTDCTDCHDPATATTHINVIVEFGGKLTAPLNSATFDGSCTNTCHVADTAGDWNGTPATVMACVDCHEATSGYVGDNSGTYLATSGLHATTALNVTPHDDTLTGVGFLGGCEGCHTAYGSEPTTHMDTNWDTNARFVTGTDLNYSAGAVNESTCGPGNSISDCHSDGGNWARLWSTDANSDYTKVTGNPAAGQKVCNVCHGSYSGITDSTGWRTGTTHATSGATKGDSHAPTTDAECEDCHAYPSGVNDRHEDDYITFSGDTDANEFTPGSFELKNDGTFSGWYCDGCHFNHRNEVIGGTHLFADSLAFPSSINYDQGDETPVGGTCDSCHGDNAGKYWPDGDTTGSINPLADDQPGLHGAHMNALILPPHNIDQQVACGYCHPFPYGPESHGNGTYGDMANQGNFVSITPWAYKRIIGGGDDADGIFNTSGNATSTCSNIDCHFDNAYTPHWYDADNVAPDAVDWKSLTVETGPNPCSIKVIYNSPGADVGLDNTTAYRYEMQVSSDSAAEAALFADSATSFKVGGLPASYLRDELTEVIIDNLDHNDTTYYVAVRAQDTEGLWGPIATAGPAAPKVDTEAPMFYGADKALAGDEGGAINLYWTEAEDHSMFFMHPVKSNRVQKPIRYEIWLKSEVRGDLDMADNTGYNSAILWDGVQTFYTGNAIELEGTIAHSNGGVSTDILDDITYQMGVRACDWLDNCDTNVKTVNVTPAAIREVPQSVHSYSSYNGTGGYEMRRDLGPGTVAGSETLDVSPAFIDFYGAAQGHDVDYYVDSFTMQFLDDRNASKVTAQLGVWNGTCNLYGSTAEVSPPVKTTSQATFKFGAIEKLNATTGQSFCIRLTTDDPITINYGTSATGGFASVVEQKANTIPKKIEAPTLLLNGAILQADWQEPLDDGDGLADGVFGEETLHYDIYGSNNGTTGPWDYVIAEDQAWTDTDVEWDTQADGITGGELAIKIRPGDGFSHALDIIGETIFGPYGPATAIDKVAPGQTTDLKALPRPKKGTVELRWTGPGDDYMNNGRASYYEIRYSTADITDFYTGTTLIENVPPYPEFGAHQMSLEVTGLPQDTPLYFALRTFDEQDNGSPMSNVSTPVNSGPSCGMCHTTGPSVVESEGNHKLHGFTMYDCDKCHTEDPAGANVKPSDFGLDHQDGRLLMGYGPEGAVEGTIPGGVGTNTIRYLDGGSTVMYEDTDGFGGFGHPDDAFVSTGDGQDNGSCINFGAMGVGGCHGPAGDDPDGNSGLSEYPTFETPYWDTEANLDCGRCHGNPNRAETATGYTGGAYKKDPYQRDYDGTIYPDLETGKLAGVVPDQIIGAPGADNRGGWDSDPLTANTVDERKYIGQHEKHLNYSFRFSKGDSCALCHYGHYKELDKLDGKHGDGEIDVLLDKTASGPLAHYNSAGTGVAGQCFSMDPYNCHPTSEAPAWDSDETFPCIGCHTMGGVANIANIGHYTDPANGIDDNIAEPGGDPDNTLDGFDQGLPGNCTWCHFAGHPTDNVPTQAFPEGTALILPNNPQVGITYKSGGIHLRKDPGNKGVNGGAGYATQAELCWGCHDLPGNDISEWGGDDGLPNDEILSLNNNVYDFGYVTTSRWNTAIWSSNYSTPGNGAAFFDYKTGAIQSTHSTNITNGQSDVTWVGDPDYQYVESPDLVADLQCHNCHDVHNMNFAKGDTMTGAPYLRGSWLSNPYPEDGAPRQPTDGNTTFASESLYGEVPRGTSVYNNIGGYQIDQNNVHATEGPPTKGWVASTAGGLCLLCHKGTGVDFTDQKEGEDLWITAGKNGHSNSALGGTADDFQITDIFSYSDRNTTDPAIYDGDYGGTSHSGNSSMGYTNAMGLSTAGEEIKYRGAGIRSGYSSDAGWQRFFTSPEVLPSAEYTYFDARMDWGVSQGSGVIVNKGYHAFSCSKCHNPHASRLPKLMITNCLDTKHNTWDNQWSPLTGTGTESGDDISSTANFEMTLSNTTSAQNCHRVGDPNLGAGTGEPGTGGKGSGWNRVTPWSTPP